jgi:putative spermidine/putrescine transport system substrate-binding protein
MHDDDGRTRELRTVSAKPPGALSSGRLLGRRALLLGAAGLGIAASGGLLAACSPKASSAGAGGGRSLKVSSYGGNFEQAMSQHVYPVFEKASGIKVESIAQPSGLQFLLQLIEANRAGLAPMDLCISTAVDINRGRNAGLWHIRDPKPLANLPNLPAQYISTGPKGIDGVGAVGWFLALVVNPDQVKPIPDSWKALWDPARKDAWGLNGGAGLLYEITATTYFGGTEILDTEAGILKVLAKIAELKPNTKLWWDSEGTMQTALENGEVQGGVYFADVAATLAASGTPLKIVFPKEGAVIDFGCWCQPTSSKKIAEADEFINFMLSPPAQDLIARKVNAPPLIRKELLDLTPAEVAKVGATTPPINVNIKARAEHLDFMASSFNQMIAS